MRSLGEGHFLFGRGQFGLFATHPFDTGDILGEYLGAVVGRDQDGPYTAALQASKKKEYITYVVKFHRIKL